MLYAAFSTVLSSWSPGGVGGGIGVVIGSAAGGGGVGVVIGSLSIYGFSIIKF